MSNAILFCATGSDEDALISYVESIGLTLVPDRPGPRSAERLPGGYFSPIPENELQTWRNPRLSFPPKYSEALDPLLSFSLSKVLPNHFKPGRVTRNLDNDRLAAQTRLNFGRISRWIRKNWPKNELSSLCWCGPEARELIVCRGLEVTDLVPGTTITYIPIDRPYRPERD